MIKFLPKSQVKGAQIDIYSYARDAGFYRLIPKIVVKAKNIVEIAKLFEYASRSGRKLVFRAGGTSLSGQSITDDILVEVNQGWKNIEVLDQGNLICVGGGVIGSTANIALNPFGRRIGPDPGSMKAAFISGIVANNASGIGSGIKYNPYHTLKSIEMVLTNGLALDSARPDADNYFLQKAPRIYAGLVEIRDTIRSSTKLTNKIIHKYRLKNTSGYSLNSFLDFDAPIDILAHLMVGSEGTLGFISQVTLRTIKVFEHKATALVLFKSLIDAAKYVPIISQFDAAALEIMDESAIKAVKHVRGLPAIIYTDLPKGIAALLLEFEAAEPKTLNEKISAVHGVIMSADLYAPLTFSFAPVEREILWKVRRELGPLHAANRPPGTTVLSEDICFEAKDLASAIQDLHGLFKTHGYDDAIIFGHSREGNLHFKLSIDFDQNGAVENYGIFMQSLVDLVIDKYDGSLKAEHGTGRNMAPFLEREWGSEAMQIMRSIKQLLDPQGILNPDVILSDDPSIHLKNIKAIPIVDKLIDPCIECGMCEKWCPSADLTLSPRRRIAVLREIKLLESGTLSDQNKAKQIHKDFRYEGVDTCATDGLCSIGCPVDINTGDLMKKYRSESHSDLAIWVSKYLQRHYHLVLRFARNSLWLAKPIFHLLRVPGLSKIAQKLPKLSKHHLPALSPFISHARSHLPGIISLDEHALKVVYLPSCINRMFGDPKQKEGKKNSVPATFLSVLAKAGIQVIYPQKVEDLCCGLTFSSKGLKDAALNAAILTTEMLWLASDSGRIPVVMDTSPCSFQMKHYGEILEGEHLNRWRDLTILDLSEYLHDYVLPRLNLIPILGEAVLHPTCSTVKMGLENKMLSVATACAQKATFPEHTGCCGFAGDRGLFFPELTKSAVENEAIAIKQCVGDAGYYSTSRTCEIGMSIASENAYSSLIYLVDAASSDQ